MDIPSVDKFEKQQTDFNSELIQQLPNLAMIIHGSSKESFHNPRITQILEKKNERLP
jgi:hypothetical protein